MKSDDIISHWFIDVKNTYEQIIELILIKLQQTMCATREIIILLIGIVCWNLSSLKHDHHHPIILLMCCCHYCWHCCCSTPFNWSWCVSMCTTHDSDANTMNLLHATLLLVHKTKQNKLKKKMHHNMALAFGVWYSIALENIVRMFITNIIIINIIIINYIVANYVNDTLPIMKQR